MPKPVYNHIDESLCPHAPDAIEREFAENGFAKGWAMHCKPVPDYYFDSHIHYSGKKEDISGELKFLAETLENFGIMRLLVIFQLYGKKWDSAMITENIMDSFPYFSTEEIKAKLGGFFGGSDRYYWSAYLNYRSPEKELVDAAAEMGARCIKLHNAPIIEDNAPFDLWLSDDWQKTFGAIAKHKLPILWHVTQRLPSSIYTGGKRNVYWENGWKKGVTYSNEDLLRAFLDCCRRHPGIDFIGAHQLHIGWERLDELFCAFPNLYVDTTIGCQLRMYDDFYPHDKEYLRSVFIRWADRILFGTDSFGKYNELNYTQHLRFITALDLPQNVLDAVCHGNLERLCGISPL
ncbi:MAG: amidohydrolase [Oscillospiraceae bacterium]|nr:amidohydrolase [Oscillospiraceae bacterium]